MLIKDIKVKINKLTDKKTLIHPEKNFKYKGKIINKGNTLVINWWKGINFDKRFKEGKANHENFHRILEFWDMDSDTVVYRFKSENPIRNESEKDYRIEYIFDEKIAKYYLLSNRDAKVLKRSIKSSKIVPLELDDYNSPILIKMERFKCELAHKF